MCGRWRADAAGNALCGDGWDGCGSAAVMKVAPDGKAAKVFEGKELGVQALRVGADGSVYAATSPDGKVYRVPASGGRRSGGGGVRSGADGGEAEVSLGCGGVGKGGEVYVAAGAPAVVYRVAAGGGKAEVCVQDGGPAYSVPADGAGWDAVGGERWGWGDLQDSTTRTAGAKPFAVYAAPRQGDYGAGDGCGGECLCGGSGDEGARWAAAAAAGDGECGGDDYVFAAGVGDCGGGEYAGAGWVGDLQDCGGWSSGEAADAEG